MAASSGQDDILVIIRRDGYHAIIQTCDRIHGTSATYTVHCAVLGRALQSDPPICHRSGNSFLTMRRQDDRLQCSIVWLTGDNGTLNGYEQSFDLLAYDAENVADGSTRWLIAIHSPRTGQEITLTCY